MKSEDFKKMSAEVKSQYDLLPIESRGTFNEFLMNMYKAQTGQIIFRTFKAWKELGFNVKKGESSFPVWSRPMNVIRKEQAAAAGQDYKESSDDYRGFAVCHLFHAGQVEKVGAVEVKEYAAAAAQEYNEIISLLTTQE